MRITRGARPSLARVYMLLLAAAALTLAALDGDRAGRAEQEVLLSLVVRRFPSFARRLRGARLPLELYSTSWLLALLLTDLPLETALRVWDVLVLPPSPGEGPMPARDHSGATTLLAASLAIIRVLQGRLYSADPRSVSALLTDGPRQLQPDNALGRHFLRAFADESRWLRDFAPLEWLRARAIAKVECRLALVQSVREGKLPPHELHRQMDDTPVSADDAEWRRQRLRTMLSRTRCCPLIPRRRQQLIYDEPPGEGIALTPLGATQRQDDTGQALASEAASV